MNVKKLVQEMFRQSVTCVVCHMCSLHLGSQVMAYTNCPAIIYQEVTITYLEKVSQKKKSKPCTILTWSERKIKSEQKNKETQCLYKRPIEKACCWVPPGVVQLISLYTRFRIVDK